MLSSLSKIVEESHREQRRQTIGQTTLFADSEVKNNDTLVDIEELSRIELLSFERELLGFYLTEHPLRPVLASLSDKITHQIGELAEASPGSLVKIGGVVTQIKKILTRAGNSEMAFVELGDLTGSVEVIVFPKVYAQNKEFLVLDQIVVITGRLDFKEERPVVLAEKINQI
jgi:DNA polymerase-3 subunit alpha